MPISSYSIAAGHGVALVSLTNIEDIAAFQVGGVGLYPSSETPDAYPVRTRVASGKEYGDGMITHVWSWQLLPQVAIEYIYDTYLAGNAITANCTIYSPRHDYDDFIRYNAYIHRFKPGQDMAFKGLDEFGNKVYANVNLRFSALVAL